MPNATMYTCETGITHVLVDMQYSILAIGDHPSSYYCASAFFFPVATIVPSLDVIMLHKRRPRATCQAHIPLHRQYAQ